MKSHHRGCHHVSTMALPPLLACVMLGGISVSLAGSSKVSDQYPPLWEDSPGRVSDYKVENGKYIINIWNYSERLGMYKILLNQTAKYFEKFAPGNEQNLLWGLPVHHGWQYHTDVNYFLSIMPFLAAAEAGVIEVSPDDVVFLPPPKDRKKFCYSTSSCHSSFPEAMKMWNEFYQHIRSPSSSFDDLLKSVWEAHFLSLKAVGKTFRSRSKYYSKLEADFQRNWALFVDYLAPTRFPTTLLRMNEFQKGLPHRILVRTDKGLIIKDLTGFQNIVLLFADCLHKVHTYTGTLSFVAWRNLMKLKVARKVFLEIMEYVLHLLI